jgi:hypothetical protein
MKAEKYADFFKEAEKTMSEDSIRRAKREANTIMLDLGLVELQKYARISNPKFLDSFSLVSKRSKHEKI